MERHRSHSARRSKAKQRPGIDKHYAWPAKPRLPSTPPPVTHHWDTVVVVVTYLTILSRYLTRFGRWHRCSRRSTSNELPTVDIVVHIVSGYTDMPAAHRSVAATSHTAPVRLSRRVFVPQVASTGPRAPPSGLARTHPA